MYFRFEDRPSTVQLPHEIGVARQALFELARLLAWIRLLHEGLQLILHGLTEGIDDIGLQEESAANAIQAGRGL